MLTSSNIKAWSKCLFYEQQCSECKFSFALSVILESGYPVNAKHAELERRSAYQLRLKAVEMLRSRTQLVKSHGDDLGLEYLWNGDEYGSLEQYEDSDKCTVFGEYFTDRPSEDIFIIQKKVTTNEN